MLGPAKARRLDEPIAVSLEDLVPPDHFYRHLEAKLDLGFVRDWARELLCRAGPALASTRSSSSSCSWSCSSRASAPSASSSRRPASTWPTAGTSATPSTRTLPDHSSLTRIRQRLGIDIFQRFFEQVVDLCQEAGLVWGRELYFDATKVEANAGIPSLVPRFYYDATTHVADLFADEADDDCTASRRPTCLQASCRCRSIAESVPAERRSAVAAAGGAAARSEPSLPSAATGAPATFGSAPPIPMPPRCGTGARIRLGYHDHYVVDGGKRRIILAALVTPADVMESQAMRDLLWRVCFRRKIWPHQVTGDAKYGTIENIVAIEDAGIRAYVPLTDFAHRTDFYGQDDFIFDPERDEYRCPQGHPLRRYATKRTEGVVAYRGDAGHLQRLPGQGQVHHQRPRPQGPALVLRSTTWRRCAATTRRRPTRRRSASARSGSSRCLPRPRSGTAYAGCGLRGLLNANIQGLLIAAGQNLKRFLAATGWGRRHAPCGSLLALPREPGRLSAVYG